MMHEGSVQISRRQALVSAAAAFAATSRSVLSSDEERRRSRKVAITIDDGPVVGAGTNLQDFLRISTSLRECFLAEQVPVIMFVNERQLNIDGQRDARVAVLHKSLDAGFSLGNHTYSHVRLGRVPVQQFQDDILKGEVVMRKLLESRGEELVWFRYPFLVSGSGATAEAIEQFLARRGYRVAPVSVDYHDYRFNRNYVRRLRAGQAELAMEELDSVVRALDFAFTQSESRSQEVLGYELPQTLLIHCNEMNSLTLRTTIREIRARGYHFVSLDEAMVDPAYNLPGIPAGGLGGGGLFNILAEARQNATARPRTSERPSLDQGLGRQ